VSLIDSETTPIDISTFKSARNAVGVRRNFDTVTTKSGAVVNRPNIVTRQQWGADESWRDRTPRISSKIIAGFIHHTATTNSYNPEDGPAQMRSLYAYFTKSLKYADMGYNFLVDRYGVVYEGRAGCAPGASSDCDGPSKAVIGAHTAGMNDNTFAISAIGNFQIGAIDQPTANLMTKAIAGLMAWKIAPYNLDPTAMANIPSTDTSGLSQYRNGTVATVPVISGHRDVGRTVCPGKYLYALVPQIRNQIAGLLVGRIQNVSVIPIEQPADDSNPISLTAKVPVSGTWNVTVVDADSGAVVYAQSGTQEGKPNFAHEWDHTDSSGHLVPAGNYAISISVTIAEKQLPTETTMVTLASKPTPMTGVKLKRLSGSSAIVSWPVQADSVPLIDAIYYRTSSTNGKTWGSWIRLADSATEQTIASRLMKRRILIEIKQTNAMGDSSPVRLSFTTKS
jgi:flagellar hook assembly protein FlgD